MNQQPWEKTFQTTLPRHCCRLSFQAHTARMRLLCVKLCAVSARARLACIAASGFQWQGLVHCREGASTQKRRQRGGRGGVPNGKWHVRPGLQVLEGLSLHSSRRQARCLAVPCNGWSLLGARAYEPSRSGGRANPNCLGPSSRVSWFSLLAEYVAKVPQFSLTGILPKDGPDQVPERLLNGTPVPPAARGRRAPWWLMLCETARRHPSKSGQRTCNCFHFKTRTKGSSSNGVVMVSSFCL